MPWCMESLSPADPQSSSSIKRCPLGAGDPPCLWADGGIEFIVPISISWLHLAVQLDQHTGILMFKFIWLLPSRKKTPRISQISKEFWFQRDSPKQILVAGSHQMPALTLSAAFPSLW